MLLAQAETADELQVAAAVGVAQVGQQAGALADHLEQAAAAVVVLLVDLEVLVQLVPRATHPDIAVLMLTQVTLPAMATFALNSGAQKYLIKSYISGDYLDRAIQRAIAFVGPRKKEVS